MELKEDIIKMIEGIKISYGVRGEFKELTYYPAVDNDKKLADKVANILGEEILMSTKPLMIAEDFSYYQKEIPGLLMLLGSKNPEKGYIHPLHSNKFDFDEKILLIGVQAMVDIILNF